MQKWDAGGKKHVSRPLMWGIQAVIDNWFWLFGPFHSVCLYFYFLITNLLVFILQSYALLLEHDLLDIQFPEFHKTGITPTSQ